MLKTSSEIYLESNMNRQSFSLFLAALLALFLANSTAPPSFAQADNKDEAEPANESSPAESGDDLTDEPQPFTPEERATALEKDKKEAAALFAKGRILIRRDDLEGGLEAYQRAWRKDPKAVIILTKIVPLAFQLKRPDEAARYAVLAAEKDPRDPVLLRRLALYLTEKGEQERALKLYETAKKLDDMPERGIGDILLQVEMGRLYFLNEEYEKSAAAFKVARQAIDSPDEFGLSEKERDQLLNKADRTYALFGEAFLEAGMTKEALEMYKRSNDAEDNAALFAIRKAKVFVAEKKWKKARKALDEYFATDSLEGGLAPFELLKEITAAENEGEKIAAAAYLKELQAMWEKDQSNAALGLATGEALSDAEKYAEAATVFKLALDLGPNLQLLRGLVNARREEGDPAKLLDALSTATEVTVVPDALGEAYDEVVEQKELTGRIVELAADKLANKPEELSATQSLSAAFLALEVGRTDLGQKLIDHTLAQEKNPGKAEVLTAWGLGLFLNEDNDAAAAVFRRCIEEKVNPENEAGYYFYLSGPLAFADKTDEALEAAKKAVSLDPENVQFQERVAWVHYRAGNYEKAKELYEKILEEYGGVYANEAIRDALRSVRMILSNVVLAMDEEDQSEEYLEQVLDEYPEDIGAMNDLGYLWIDRNINLHRAIPMVEKAVEDQPENKAYRDSLGWGYYRLGEYEKALAELEKAADGEEDPDGVILEHLGDTHNKLGNKEQAEKNWRAALKAFEAEEDKDKAARVKKKLGE
jgi:tetratricopeptide (TPR) repeat protein